MTAAAKKKRDLTDFFNTFGGSAKEKKNEEQTVEASLAEKQKQISLDQSGDSIKERLNWLIRSGVRIYVLEDDFENYGRKLSAEEEAYFRDNFDVILCFLQQALLQKRVFSDRKDLFNEFAQSIYEREKNLIEKGKDKHEAYLEAVKYQTRDWFVRLLTS